jgi:hypothetical protein
MIVSGADFVKILTISGNGVDTLNLCRAQYPAKRLPVGVYALAGAIIPVWSVRRFIP